VRQQARRLGIIQVAKANNSGVRRMRRGAIRQYHFRFADVFGDVMPGLYDDGGER
jgi:hypothetical protein